MVSKFIVSPYHRVVLVSACYRYRASRALSRAFALSVIHVAKMCRYCTFRAKSRKTILPARCVVKRTIRTHPARRYRRRRAGRSREAAVPRADRATAAHDRPPLFGAVGALRGHRDRTARADRSGRVRARTTRGHGRDDGDHDENERNRRRVPSDQGATARPGPDIPGRAARVRRRRESEESRLPRSSP